MKVNLLPPSAPLEGVLRRRFPVAETEVALGGRTLKVLHPADIDGLIHRANEEDELPFWAYLWPAGIGLAHFLLSEVAPTPVPARRMALELGCGVGLAGLAAALAGWEVVQTDLSPHALQFARVNALRNGLTLSGFVADWRRFPVRARFDLILASDILYEPKLHPALIRLLRERFAPGGRILISDPCRVYALQFMARLEDFGASITLHDAPGLSEDDPHVFIYEAWFPFPERGARTEVHAERPSATCPSGTP